MKKKLLIIPFLALFLAQGCGVWTDVTTYFNLYFNAKELYDEAELLIITERKDIYAITEPNAPTQSITMLNKVVEKFSRLLQFHNTSSYVDNALLFTGKSFYYQRSYQKALRKFQELLAKDSESKRYTEGSFWLAKTLMALRRYNEGLLAFDETKKIATEQNNKEILTLIAIEQVRYLKSQEKFQEVVTKLKEVAELTNDNNIAARTYFELGETYLLLNNLQLAEESYRRTLDFSPEFEIEYNAMINLGKVLRIQGNLEEAMALFNNMYNQNKFSDRLDRVGLERGITQRSLGLFDDAYKTFYTLDTSYTNSVSTGAARYEMGEMFEKDYKIFDSAAVYYKKAENSASPAEYVQKIRDRGQLFKRYEKLIDDKFNYRQQMYYAENPDQYVADSLDYVVYINKLSDPFFELDTASIDEDVRRIQMIDSLISAGLPVPDSLMNPEKYINPEEQIFEDESQLTKIDEESKLEDPNSTLNPVEERKPPVRPLYSLDSLLTLTYSTYYALGNIHLNDFKILDSAYFYYDTILTNMQETALTPRVLFAFASYYELTGNRVIADSLFNEIYERFPNEVVANYSAQKIDKPTRELELNPAKILFMQAEQSYFEKQFLTAVGEYYSVFESHPESDLAPKALLAAGYILENELVLNDSAFVVYDTLLTKFPQNRHSAKINSKVQFYKAELRAKEQAKQDSIKAVQDSIIAVQDSIRNAEQIILDSVMVDSVKSDSVLIQEYVPSREEIEKMRELEENKIIEEQKEEESEEGVDNLSVSYRRNFHRDKIIFVKKDFQKYCLSLTTIQNFKNYSIRILT
ncbi:MAG: tetratricopeptide repeat protein [Ignavibacteriaceae bacterium]|nr:tetratricopeptide repeat protein [Ignavibacteriaceae bacterium]